MKTKTTFAKFFHNLTAPERILLCGVYEAWKQPKEIHEGDLIAELSLQFVIVTSQTGEVHTAKAAAKAAEFMRDLQIIFSELHVDNDDDEYCLLLALYRELMGKKL